MSLLAHLQSHLSTLGCNVTSEWLNWTIQSIVNMPPPTNSSAPVSTLSPTTSGSTLVSSISSSDLQYLMNECFVRFCDTDMSLSCSDPSHRRLPAGCQRWHKQAVSGKHLVQVESFEDIAHSNAELAEKPIRDDRMWKLILTDGVDIYIAIERQRCHQLSYDAMRKGVKVRCRRLYRNVSCRPFVCLS